MGMRMGTLLIADHCSNGDMALSRTVSSYGNEGVCTVLSWSTSVVEVYISFERAIIAAFNRRTFQAFLNWLAPANNEPLPLPVIPKQSQRRFVIQQPCWRSGRWKSLT